MKDIFENARDLAKQINESLTYSRYIDAKKIVDINPEYVAIIKNYKNLRFKFLSSHNDGKTLSETERDASEAFYNIMLNPDLCHFIKCEQEAVNLINLIVEILSEKNPIEFWTDY